MSNVIITEAGRYVVQVYVGALSQHYEALSVEASKQTSSEEIVQCIVERLQLGNIINYELAEVVGDECGQECKERRLGSSECPVACMLLWPKDNDNHEDRYRFYLREKLNDNIWADGFNIDPELIRDYFYRFLYQPQDREYPDLCQLSNLNENTLLENLRARFDAGHIYTYVGSILIAVNPFKFHPIYNPKYVKLYQNRRLGPDLPPHIFAIADSAYHCMLRNHQNQCIVISGESGSGKTESTNFLLHHLTALSQKGSHGSGVEQTILSAGPVLEAFGNAKTAHNNNSSRFGKFIQVNYKENGMVHGAVVQKYLLEKSRICSQGRGERNYHVFYYLLAGASEQDRQTLHLKKIDSYHYLNRSGPYTLDNVDEKYEFSRLQQSMEMVGFTLEKQRRLFAVLSAVLLLGNVEFVPRKSAYHHDESVTVRNTEVVELISELLRVKKETLLSALTAKHARASDETLVINYRLPEAIAARDAMAKCLYGALFDWIVMQVNHALLSKKDTLRAHQGNSIGVLDIFGFEDFGPSNSFEQLCINYANEHLQHYFNQHVFQYEQEEYNKEGIKWRHIEFSDNTLCLQLVEGKLNGLLCLLDDQANFPGATNETLLQKFNTVHRDNPFYEMPQRRENAFIVKHYAGKVKYQVTEMREKNLDLMRAEIVGVLKNSSMAFVRELVGADPVAVFRWAIVRAFFRGMFAFQEAGRRYRSAREGGKVVPVSQWCKNYNQKDNNKKNKSYRPRDRGSKKGMKNLQSVKTVAGKGQTTPHGTLSSGKRKQPLTVTAQFQQSLHCLMDTLNKANPFFIRCIKSNAKKIPNNFDIDTVQRQLRYTGMLETVRIRQAGYNVRLSYDEFIQLYRILLPQGLASKPEDVRDFLLTLNLNRDNYQIGTSKIFLRESEKLRLDFRLHQQIMASIVAIQKGVRAYIERKRFCRLKEAAITIQRWWRTVIERRCLRNSSAASVIQKVWRGYKTRLWYQNFRTNLINFQAHARGYLLRKDIRSKKRRKSKNTSIDDETSSISLSIIDNNESNNKMNRRKESSDSSNNIIVNKPKLSSQNNNKSMTCEEDNNRSSISSSSTTRNYNKNSSTTCDDTDIDDLDEKLTFHMLEDTIDRELFDSIHLLNKNGGSGGSREEDSEERRHQIQVGDPKDILNIAPKSSLIKQCSLPTPTSTSSISSKTESLGGSPQSGESPNKTDKTSLAQQKIKIFSRSSTNSQGSFSSQSTTMTNNENNNNNKNTNNSLNNYYSSGGSDSEEQIEGINNDDEEEEEEEEKITTAVWKRQTTKTITNVVPEQSKYEPITITRTTSSDSTTSTSSSSNKKYNLNRALPVSSQPTAPVRIARRQKEYTRTDERTALLNLVVDSNSCDNTIRHSLHGKSSLPTSQLTNDLVPQLQLKRRNSDTSQSKSIKLYSGGEGGGEETDQSNNIRNIKKPVQYSISSDYETSSKVSCMFTIAGHTFSEELTKFNKYDKCKYCDKYMEQNHKSSSMSGGHRCHYCNECFHTKCIQNGGAVNLPCQRLKLGGYSNQNAISSHSSSSIGGTSHPSPRGGNIPLRTFNNNKKIPIPRKNSRHSANFYDRKSIISGSSGSSINIGSISGSGGSRISSASSTTTTYEGGKFNLTGTSEFTDSTDKIISDARQLQLMQDFITRKIYKMDADGGDNSSHVDRVFKQALKEFKDNLVATYSVAIQQNPEKLNIKYKDLIVNFLQVMQTVCHRQNTREDFPVTMGVNAFRGFMNEFMNNSRVETEKPNKIKRKKEKKRTKQEDKIIHFGHVFESKIINIPTACEICNSLFKWPIERMFVCQNCKSTCHRKCYKKIPTGCGAKTRDSTSHGNKVFGVPLNQLGLTDGKIPIVIDRLIYYIELRGLYIEGIYRKSGIHSKIQEIKLKLDEGKISEIESENNVHLLANVLKLFLREMPEPLLTFECYEDFLRAADLTEDRESTLFSIIKTLPKPNFDLMERLIFHLARVASHEQSNRMNCNSLAIVFAPCILRNKDFPAQDALSDISRQTLCIELIISEQLKKITSTLKDIDDLDKASHTANHRLSSIRSSKIFSQEELLPATKKLSDEEHLLETHLKEIKKEKDHLTCRLPSLTRTNSDDDLLSTDDGSLDEIDGGSMDQASFASYTNTKPAKIIIDGEQKKIKKKMSTGNPPPDEDPIMV